LQKWYVLVFTVNKGLLQEEEKSFDSTKIRTKENLT
jgi:hypothetical protein